ncbi:DUF1642 domain-containing protein [Lactococcus lactis]|uniref:DUF1642 domain-containing protein n=1 Tax=Lactococcus lactis TaxID=1358 RepID=A0A9X4NJM5_9LACT|nr:DUF1642 domain-containing protein [Lactococcus lactis]MDG4984929.1 DUF1642 domain-containing protein [Lactococcus lactis]
MTTFEEKLKTLPIKIIEHSGYTKYYSAANVKLLIAKADTEIEYLKAQLEPQALPVVPGYVAEWYEANKSTLEYSIYLIHVEMKDLEDNELTDIQIWFDNRNNKSLETIFKMKDGYIIEKPKLFRLKLRNTADRNHYLWLNRATNRIFIDKKFLDWTNHDNVKNSFTEQEITEILDGAFVNNEAFEIVPVEEINE